MPTGYTAAIKDGISFETFALNCARAFGACVELRDEPGGGEHIPDAFEPRDHYLKALRKARRELAELEDMTTAERERAAVEAWESAEASRLERLDDMRKQRAAYESMLAKVKAWKTPTPDHAGLHDFMRKQIEESIDFDCKSTYCNSPTIRMSGKEWAENRRASLLRDIERHAKNHADEVKRAADRTAWVQALRASL